MLSSAELSFPPCFNGSIKTIACISISWKRSFKISIFKITESRRSATRGSGHISGPLPVQRTPLKGAPSEDAREANEEIPSPRRRQCTSRGSITLLMSTSLSAYTFPHNTSKTGLDTDNRQQWTQELERYAKDKNQSEPIRTQAMKLLANLDGAKLYDDNVAAITSFLHDEEGEVPWRAQQTIRLTFAVRYVESCLENIIISLATQATTLVTGLQWQTRGICIQSVLAKWYCGCLANFSQRSIASACLNSRGLANICTSGYEEGTGATQIAATPKLLASAAREWETTCNCTHPLWI